jgi:hypothetical protein
MPKIINKNSNKEKLIKSYWSDSAQRFFVSLHEIPWISLTAISTLAGVLILFAYFRSIDHFPSDFSAVIGLGAAAAACAVGFLIAISLSLFGPTFVYHNSSLVVNKTDSSKNKNALENELIFLQLGGVGALSLYMAYPEFRDCGEILNAWILVGGVLVLIGLFAFGKVVSQGQTWGERFDRGWSCFLIAFMAITPLFFLAVFLQNFKSNYVNSFMLLLCFWTVIIAVNSVAATRLASAKPLAFILSFVTAAYLVFLVPLATSNPSFFPAMVAGYLGVREADFQTLQVPIKTCNLITGSISTGSQANDLVCSSGDWGQVKAQVLSNVGERWLIEIATENIQTKQASKLRLTVPRAEIQTVKSIKLKPKDEKPTVCSTP